MWNLKNRDDRLERRKEKMTVYSRRSATSSEVTDKLVNDIGAFRSDLQDFNAKYLEHSQCKIELRELKEMQKTAHYV